MRRLLIISYSFPPSAVVGGLRPLRMARHLPDFGYDVDVLTTGVGEGERDFDMQLLDAIPANTVVHRVPVRYFLDRDPWKVPPTTEPLRRAWWKVRSYVTHVLGPLDWFALWARDAAERAEHLLREHRYDAVLISAPPFSPLVECAALKRRTGCPLVLDFRDLWTARLAESTEARGQAMRSAMGPEARRLEGELVQLADRVIVNSPEAVALEQRAFPGASSSKFHCVPNAYDGAPPDTPGGLPRRPRAASEPVLLIHAGTLSAGRSVAALHLLMAAAQLNRQSTAPMVHVRFVGSGEPGLVRQLADQAGAAELVSEVEWVPRQKSLELQGEADVLVVLQSGSFEGRSAVPAKLYEYMTARRWILGVLPEGPAARIMREERLGDVGRWDDPADVLTALRGVVARVRAGSLAPAPPEKYAARETMRQLAGVLDDLLEQRPDHPRGG